MIDYRGLEPNTEIPPICVPGILPNPNPMKQKALFKRGNSGWFIMGNVFAI